MQDEFLAVLGKQPAGNPKVELVWGPPLPEFQPVPQIVEHGLIRGGSLPKKACPALRGHIVQVQESEDLVIEFTGNAVVITRSGLRCGRKNIQHGRNRQPGKLDQREAARSQRLQETVRRSTSDTTVFSADLPFATREADVPRLELVAMTALILAQRCHGLRPR